MKTMHILLASTALAVAARAHAEDNSEAIRNALGQLDPKNDAHWTAAGEPRIDTLKSLTGDATITRPMVEAARPGFNREAAGGENRPGTPDVPATDQAPADQEQGDTLGAKLLADGWQPHPTNPDYAYRGEEVVKTTELAARYGASGADSGASGTQTTAEDISGQTGMGGATTARSPEPVEGEVRRTHVELPSNGEPGERPIGVVQGVTDAGANQLGTPEGTVQNAGRDIELSGEVAARAAGSVLTPTQAPAQGSNTPSISLGGAADPLVEAKAAGGAVIAEGADGATFFEGATAGGPFGHSGITAGDGPSQAQLEQMGHDFAGDPDAVAAGEAELEQASARSEELRRQIDDLSSQLHTSLRTEAQLRRQIEANRPQSGNIATIQTFLRSQQERRAAAARANK